MSWSKAYQNWIIWENRPSTKSPIDEIALNKISYGVDEIDDRVIDLDARKVEQADFLTVVQSVTMNTTTGELIITFVNGSTHVIDTLLEKIAINFDFDEDPTSEHYQQLIIELDDGTYKYVDLSALITEFEFVDSDSIAFTTLADGTIKAVVKNGSIHRQHLDPDYLGEMEQAVADAAGSASDAANSASNAHADMLMAESHNHGNTGMRTDENTDNAKYYKEQAALMRDNAQDILDGITDVQDQINDRIEMSRFTVDFTTGNLVYTNEATYEFTVDTTDGMLKWEVR